MTTMTLRYKQQQSNLTLREGLSEHLAAEGIVYADDPTFAAHDACHVLFGLDTSLRDEILVDTWTMLATDMTPGRYAEVLAKPEVSGLLSSVPVGTMLTASVRALPDLVRVWWRSRQVTRQWAFADYSEHLDTPLVELRARHGIRVLAA